MARIAVRNPSGKIVYVDQEGIEDAYKSGDYSPVSSEDVTAHEDKVARRKSFEGVLPTVAAGGLGALRSASVGLSDALAVGLADLVGGEGARERASQFLSDAKKYNPIASGVGEAVGFAAPLLLSGGSAGALEGAALGAEELTLGGLGKAALKGVSAPLRGVNAAGHAVESGLAAALGEKAIVAPLAARAATEGAILGAGNAISDQALSLDPELTAEHILPDILSGALGGLVVGGAAGTVLKGARSLFREAAPIVKSLEETMPGAAHGTFPGVTPETKPLQQSLGEKVEGLSNQRLFKAMEPLIRDERMVEKFASGGEEVAARFKAQLERTGGKALELHSLQDFSTQGQKFLDEFGDQLGKFENHVDAMPSTFHPKTATTIERLNSELSKVVDENPFDKSLTRKVGGLVNNFSKELIAKEAEDGTIKISDLRDLRKKLDKIAFPQKEKGTLLTHSDFRVQAQKLRGVVEDYIEEVAETASKQLPAEQALDYVETKKNFQMAKIVSGLTEDALARRRRNATISLSDMMAFAGAQSPVGGVFSALAHKVIRERGNAVASGLLSRAAKLMTVNEAALAAEKEIGSGIVHFLDPREGMRALSSAGASSPIFVGSTSDERQKSYDAYTTKLKERVGNPEQQFADITQRIGDMGTIAPETTAHVVNKSMAIDQFIASKMPENTGAQDSIFPNKGGKKISDAEIAKFGRYVSAAQGGSRYLMQELKAHRLSPETVETMKALYPASHALIQKAILTDASRRPKDLSFQQKLQLFYLFGVPTDSLLSPQARQLFQNNYAKETNKAMGLSPSGKPRQAHMNGPHAVSTSYATELQRIQGGS